MANEKIMNTRIQLKYDSLASWQSSAFNGDDTSKYLKTGEVAVVTVDTWKIDSEGNQIKVPTCLMKIGDGKTKFDNLNWVAAQAADVYEWAKKPEAEFTNWVKGLIEVTDIDAYSKKEVDDKLTANSTADQAYTDAAIAKLDAEVSQETGDDGLALSITEVDGKITAISGSIKPETYDAYGSAAAEKERAEGIEAGLQSAIDAINNSENGILKQAKDYADGKDEAIADAKKAGTDAMTEAKAKVASVAAADKSVTVAGTSTAPTVAVKLDPSADNALKLNENGLKVEIGAAPEYSIVKAENSGDYAAVYNLTKDGAIVGASINIPKDMVVKSGSVVGDEIVLVLNDEAATEIKIPVTSLIEYVTSGSATGDMVVVNVSDDHKVTATITDGTITLTKLHVDVQTAIGKAHSHDNKTILDAISAGDIEKWNGAQAAAEATAAAALSAAKTELEGKIDDAKTDASNKVTVALAEAQKGIAAVQGNLDTHTGNADIHVTANDKATWNGAVQTVTAAADSGLKAVKTGNDVAIEIDDTITWIFDCGSASV